MFFSSKIWFCNPFQDNCSSAFLHGKLINFGDFLFVEKEMMLIINCFHTIKHHKYYFDLQVSSYMYYIITTVKQTHFLYDYSDNSF